MLLSVVVATYNRADTLRITLERLARQTLQPANYEVIVVDDGSPDNTAGMVAGLIAAMPYELRFLRHENRGPGATENRGVLDARGELILLIADDIHLAPDALQKHLEIHTQRPEPWYAALGCVVQSPDLPQTMFQRLWDPFKYYELKGTVELPYWKFWACQISLKRQFMIDNGMFREHKGAAHEDVELGYRLCKKGLRIFYHPECLGWHYHPETLEASIRRAFERGRHWNFIEENVPDPQIWVKYHILNWKTIRYHVQTFRNLSACALPAEDRNLAWLLFRQAVRWIVFNRLTIPAWIAFFKFAEKHPFAEKCLSPYMLRGVVFWYFIDGCRHSSIRTRQKGAPDARGEAAAG